MTMTETTPPETAFEPPREAHLVSGDQDVTAAYIEGTPITALCGKVFVPTRDPERYPLCERCAEQREAARRLLGE